MKVDLRGGLIMATLYRSPSTSGPLDPSFEPPPTVIKSLCSIPGQIYDKETQL